MLNQNERWNTAFAMSSLQDKHFFVIIEHGISAILRGGKDVKIGDFFLVKYAFNSNATEAHRAQHVITQYKPIEPLAQVRIDEDELNRKHVLLRTEAKIIEMVTSSTNRVVARLYNDTFGYFIDLRGLVRKTDKIVDFEFKCKASDKDKYSSIFVPVNVIGYHDYPIKVERPKLSPMSLIGFVCSQIQPNGTRYVWSRDLERDAVLDQQFCPPDKDVCGVWVEMSVDPVSFEVINMVRIIEHVLPTRIKWNVPEVESRFQYDGFYHSEGFHMYRNKDFGLICDPEKVIHDIIEGGHYTGWIFRKKTNISGCRWKISPHQNTIYSECTRLSSQVSRHLDDHLGSRNEFEHSQSDIHSRRNIDSSDLFNNESSSRCEQREYHNYDNDEYSSRSSVSRALTSDSDDEGNDRKKALSSLDDVVPARRRVIASNSSDDRLSDNSDEECERSVQLNDAVGNKNRKRSSMPVEVTSSRSDQEYDSLQKKLKSYRSLVKYFTNSKHVFDEMLNYNAEKLDELMELIRD